MDSQTLADELGTNADHIRHLAREGKLPCFKLGGKYLFDLPEVLRSIRHERPREQREEAVE
jgi:excisionase family DNA binding protein